MTPLTLRSRKAAVSELSYGLPDLGPVSPGDRPPAGEFQPTEVNPVGKLTLGVCPGRNWLATRRRNEPAPGRGVEERSLDLEAVEAGGFAVSG